MELKTMYLEMTDLEMMEFDARMVLVLMLIEKMIIQWRLLEGLTDLEMIDLVMMESDLRMVLVLMLFEKMIIQWRLLEGLTDLETIDLVMMYRVGK